MSRIESVEVTCIGPQAERPTWSHDLPEQFMTLIVVRVRTDDGVEGVGATWNATSFEFDRYTAEAMRHLIPILIGKDPLEREAILHEMRPRVFPLPGGALAPIEVALFDLAAQQAGMPLYRFLGGTRDRLPAYASPPLLDDVPAYLDFVAECLDGGIRAIKFHTWCDPVRDLALARAVRREHPDHGIDFMLDVENNYTREEAMRAGHELVDLGFRWFEAPLPDNDLEGYRALVRELSIPILPSGNWIQDLSFFDEAIRTRTWSAARTDVTMMGGIAQARKAAVLARRSRTRLRVHGMGLQPRRRRELAPHARRRELQLFRAGDALRALRVRDDRRDPSWSRRLGARAHPTGARPAGGLGGDGSGRLPHGGEQGLTLSQLHRLQRRPRRVTTCRQRRQRTFSTVPLGSNPKLASINS